MQRRAQRLLQARSVRGVAPRPTSVARAQRWLTLLAIAALALAPRPVRAATITVNDSGDNTSAHDAKCTLREAIANVNAASDTTGGDCAAGTGSGDTIVFDLTLPATITLTTNTELAISANVTIRGPTTGALAIDGNSQATRVFAITAGTVSMTDLAIQNGEQNGDGSHLGGGIFLDSGARVTLINCTLSGNSADVGGGLYNNGRATVTNCTLSGNHANGEGGGIENRGTVTLTNSTLSGNSGTYGGGDLANYGTATLNNCTLTLSENSGCCGDGIENIYGSTMTLSNCTLSRDGFANGGTATLVNTIIASSDRNCNLAAPIVDGGHNLSSDNTCFSSPDSLLNTDPRLAPLGNYGGPTATLALCTAVGIPDPSCSGPSPAIDAGDDAVSAPPLSLTTDQRGLPRKLGLHVDIGAVESSATSCVGDCGYDGNVTVDELVLMVNIALENLSLSECEAGDSNHDSKITIDEILVAVNDAINECPGSSSS